jgi:YD repeat-containing protein
LVTFIQRGTWNEKMEYDQSGKIISRTWADGKIWSYTYLEKVSMWGRMDDNIESGSNYPR